MDDAKSTGPAGGLPLSADAATGLIGALFDMSFRSFVTPRVIQLVFVLQMIILAIALLGMVASAFTQGAGMGLLLLLLSPVLFLIGVLAARIYLELVIVLFRIYETLRDRPA